MAQIRARWSFSIYIWGINLYWQACLSSQIRNNWLTHFQFSFTKLGYPQLTYHILGFCPFPRVRLSGMWQTLGKWITLDFKNVGYMSWMNNSQPVTLLVHQYELIHYIRVNSLRSYWFTKSCRKLVSLSLC